MIQLQSLTDVSSAETSLRTRRSCIRRGNQMTPGDQLRRAVIAIDDTFDQRRPLAVRNRDLDGFGELTAVLGAQAAAMTVLGVEHLDQSGVIPILDVVVGTVVDLDLDRVSMIVDQEDDDRQLLPDHLRHFLCRELEGTIADHGNAPTVRRAERIAENGGNGPSNMAPLHLALEARSCG